MIAPPDRRPLAGTARPTTDADGSPLPPTAIVSGAGPGGAAAALLLAAVGFGVTVLERQAVPAAVGGALLLQPNGLAVLAGLGLADDLARCRQVRSGTIRDGCGRRLLEAPVHTAGPGLDANVVIRRSQLFSLLRDRLAAHPGIDVRFGHAATAFDGEHVEVATPTGTVGWRADLVVAADGIGSALRPWIVPPELVQVVPGRTYARAIVDGPVPGGAVGEWWTDLGLFGAAELDDGAYVFAAAAHPDLVAALESGDVGAFASRWAEELPLAGELLGRVPDGGLLVHRADEVHAGRWVTERAALLGDA
ncbi:MAG TPA: FAD-dependent monooxygenase, partial [Aquihabitans sp.]|nr:FAD-dependent monooxygenase [Aquihabitans sp.]